MICLVGSGMPQVGRGCRRWDADAAGGTRLVHVGRGYHRWTWMLQVGHGCCRWTWFRRWEAELGKSLLVAKELDPGGRATLQSDRPTAPQHALS